MVRHWLLAGLLALAGCAGGGLSGIPQEPGAAHPALQALAQRADGGDKQAQLALGILYEQGRFLGQDLDRAENLYERAAKPSGGTIYVNKPEGGASSLDKFDVLVTDTHSPQLCDIDVVRLYDTAARMQTGFVNLGEFVPYRRAKD